MVNIHLYPSQFLNESRILREATSIARFDLFESIDLVGMGGAGLPDEERVADDVRIVRFGIRREGQFLVGKILDAVRWSFTVFRAYGRTSLACVNCHSVAMLPLGCVLKLFTGARLVYDAHELETETAGLRGVRKVGTKLVERALIRFVDYCVFVGTAIDEWYRDTYGLENTAVVYNSPRLTTVDATDVFRETHSIDPEDAVFLYQGVLSEARGIPKLIEAFSGLDGAALVLMGYGDLMEWVQSEVTRHVNIYFQPAVAPDRLLSFTAAADFGLSVIEPASLSYEYCLPNKLFEYLMAGKPVLVSPTREQRQLVCRYGVGVILEDTSTQSIRTGANRLMATDPRTLEAGMGRVRDDYGWERQEETLRHIYVERLAFAARRGAAT